MIKTILVPLDGSPTSTEGLRRAIQLARDISASLSILYVVDDAALHRSVSKEYAGDVCGGSH